LWREPAFCPVRVEVQEEMQEDRLSMLMSDVLECCEADICKFAGPGQTQPPARSTAAEGEP
jgi:hypothetical protein